MLAKEYCCPYCRTKQPGDETGRSKKSSLTPIKMIGAANLDVDGSWQGGYVETALQKLLNCCLFDFIEAEQAVFAARVYIPINIS
jgi:hypothetical protein